MRGLEPTDWVKVGWEDEHKKYDYDYDKDEDEDEDEDEGCHVFLRQPVAPGAAGEGPMTTRGKWSAPGVPALWRNRVDLAAVQVLALRQDPARAAGSRIGRSRRPTDCRHATAISRWHARAKANRFIVGEGPETVLSGIDVTGYGGVACIGSGRLGDFAPPPEVTEVIVAVDNDKTGFDALNKLAPSLIAEKIVVPVASAYADERENYAGNDALRMAATSLRRHRGGTGLRSLRAGRRQRRQRGRRERALPKAAAATGHGRVRRPRMPPSLSRLIAAVPLRRRLDHPAWPDRRRQDCASRRRFPAWRHGRWFCC